MKCPNCNLTCDKLFQCERYKTHLLRGPDSPISERCHHEGCEHCTYQFRDTGKAYCANLFCLPSIDNFRLEDVFEHRTVLPAYAKFDWDNHKKRLGFHECKDLLLGIELEIEYCPEKGNQIQQVAAILDRYIPKHYTLKKDLSLNDGVEICLVPMTMGYFKQLPISEMLMALRKEARCSSFFGGTCGFHVHTPESKWVSYAIRRARQFHIDNRRELVLLSRRYTEELDRYAQLPLDMAGYECCFGNESKYKAFAHRGTTIEFRLFRGSLKYEDVLAYLEFAQGLWTMCTYHPGWVKTIWDFYDAMAKLGYSAIVDFIERHLPRSRPERIIVEQQHEWSAYV